MSGTVTAKEIAEATGMTDRSVRQRANQECWVFSQISVRGGQQRRYAVLPLPVNVRTAVMALMASRESERAGALAAGQAEAGRAKVVQALDGRVTEATRQAGLAKFVTLPASSQRRAEARVALVELARHYLRLSGLPKRTGLELFTHEYRTGVIQVPPWIRDTLPKLCANSLVNWQAQLKSDGLARLGGKHGEHRKGSGIIDSTPALRDFVLGMIVDHPHATAKHVMRGIRARFAAELHPSYRTLQRWMATWKEENAQLHTAISNPDAWRSKYQAAGGNASESTIRLNQRWEMDSTKGDLILADGTRHVVVAAIDVYSRRMKLHVSRSSSSAAVAATLRRAMLDWGVPEILVTDNGSDYVSRHITRVIGGLGIERDLAPPYTPEHKPHIERSFGTFCRDLVELLPGYIGHDVVGRKAIEARRSFAQRMMKEGGSAEIRMTAAELQQFCDQWADNVYAREPHAGLKGRTPFDVATAWKEPVRRIGDERALDVLLAAAPDGEGMRRITKKGVRLDNAWFEAAPLGGLEGQEVRILLDESDIGRIFVFEADGPFICIAECPERTGISRAELSAGRRGHQKRAMSEQKAVLKAIAKAADTGTIVHEILIERGDGAGKVSAFPQPAVSHATEALDQAGRAARSGMTPDPSPVGAAEAARLAQLEAEMSAPAEIIAFETKAMRFRRALALQGRPDLTADEARWLQNYQRQPEYTAAARLYEDFGEESLTA